MEVVDLSVSVNHSAFVVAGGYLITLGKNSEGQLGLGHKKDASSQMTVVKKVQDKFITVSFLPIFQELNFFIIF